MSSTAQNNTQIFRDVFHSVPDDGGTHSSPNFLEMYTCAELVRTNEDYENFVTDTEVGHVADYNMPLQYVVGRLSQVRGHIVTMPLHYMEHVVLIQGGINLEVNDLTGISSEGTRLIGPEDIYT